MALIPESQTMDYQDSCNRVTPSWVESALSVQICSGSDPGAAETGFVAGELMMGSRLFFAVSRSSMLQGVLKHVAALGNPVGISFLELTGNFRGCIPKHEG